MILLLYVEQSGSLTSVRGKLALEFKVEDLGRMYYFLGLEV